MYTNVLISILFLKQFQSILPLEYGAPPMMITLRKIVRGRSRCSVKRDYDYDQYNFEKRLDKLKKQGFRLEQIIIVDDSPEKTRNNYGNAIYIKEFIGYPNDKELNFLHDYLLTLKEVENIRLIEKRGWRKL